MILHIVIDGDDDVYMESFMKNLYRIMDISVALLMRDICFNILISAGHLSQLVQAKPPSPLVCII